MRPDEQPPARRRRRGRGEREPADQPGGGEDLGWLADLRSAKEQRADIGPAGAVVPVPGLPQRRPSQPRPEFTPLSAPPSQGRHSAQEGQPRRSQPEPPRRSQPESAGRVRAETAGRPPAGPPRAAAGSPPAPRSPVSGSPAIPRSPVPPRSPAPPRSPVPPRSSVPPGSLDDRLPAPPRSPADRLPAPPHSPAPTGSPAARAGVAPGTPGSSGAAEAPGAPRRPQPPRRPQQSRPSRRSAAAPGSPTGAATSAGPSSPAGSGPVKAASQPVPAKAARPPASGKTAGPSAPAKATGPTAPAKAAGLPVPAKAARPPAPAKAAGPSAPDRPKSGSPAEAPAADRPGGVERFRVARSEIRRQLREQKRARATALAVVVLLVLGAPMVYFGILFATRDPVLNAVDQLRVPDWAAQSAEDRIISGSRWCLYECRSRQRTLLSEQATEPTAVEYHRALTEAGWVRWEVEGCPLIPVDGDYSCWRRDEYTLDLWVHPPECAYDPRNLRPDVEPTDDETGSASAEGDGSEPCGGSIVEIKMQNRVQDLRGLVGSGGQQPVGPQPEGPPPSASTAPATGQPSPEAT